MTQEKVITNMIQLSQLCSCVLKEIREILKSIETIHKQKIYFYKTIGTTINIKNNNNGVYRIAYPDP